MTQQCEEMGEMLKCNFFESPEAQLDIWDESDLIRSDHYPFTSPLHITYLITILSPLYDQQKLPS